MLTLLNISNIALIDELRVEFDRGLNLLTGETGSGKSIIVDALGVLIGGRFTSDLLKAGETRAFIEGLFLVAQNPELEQMLQGAGIEVDGRDANEIVIRRELAANGRNKIFINHQLATQALLRDLRPFLVDIHGQGEQQTLFNPDTHMELLDAYAGVTALSQDVAARYKRWAALKRELDEHRQDEAEKFQLVDILRDERLEEERRRLMNVEKLTTLCAESFGLTYEDNDSAITRIRQATRRVEELSGYESSFRGYLEGLESAGALLEDLAFSLRDFADKLEFSPERLAEIEHRLAEISRLKRKYGGSIESALEHLARSQDRLRHIERANVGESVRPLAKVASGGEASRLMLVLKTIASASEFPRTIVFDEIDAGIGGRVSEAVGVKLKKLSETNQVLCVTHQPQIARFADSHLLVRKEAVAGRTEVNLDRLDRRGRVEEIARMLTGAEITESARRHAREMLKV
jgi:DNA repair protein RecN (Recombination protein N)